MPDKCPECGAAVEFQSRIARVAEGRCSECDRSFTLLVGGGPTPEPGVAPAPGAELPVRCDQCHGTLVASGSSGRGDGFEAVCTGCEARLSFVRAPGPGARTPRRFRDEERPGGRGGPERSGGRPCRECGGTIRFTTDEDGRVHGECVSCGNRFELRPRPGGGSFGRRPGGPGGRGRFAPGEGRGRRWPPRRGPGGNSSSPGAAYRPRRRRFEETDEEEPPRRPRRTRRE